MCANANGSRVLVLGVSYKKDSMSLRESPALTIIELLKAAGRAPVNYHDPYFPGTAQRPGHTICRCNAFPSTTWLSYDCVAIIHRSFDPNYPAIVREAQLVLTLANATRCVSIPENLWGAVLISPLLRPVSCDVNAGRAPAALEKGGLKLQG